MLPNGSLSALAPTLHDLDDAKPQVAIRADGGKPDLLDFRLRIFRKVQGSS